MFCGFALGTDFHLFHLELLSEEYVSATAYYPYKNTMKVTAIVEPSEFDCSLAKCCDNSCVLDLDAMASERCYFDVSQHHIYD